MNNSRNLLWKFFTFLKYFFTRVFIFIQHRVGFGGSGMKMKSYLWIRHNLPKNSTIIELGGGYVSTRWLHRRYNLITIESESKFINLYGSNYIYAPLAEDGWYDVGFFHSSSCPRNVDLLIVDGPKGHLGRSGLLKHIGDLPNSKFTMFDDTNRMDEKSMASKFASMVNCSIVHYDGFSIVF
jgi:hypothetical protein